MTGMKSLPITMPAIPDMPPFSPRKKAKPCICPMPQPVTVTGRSSYLPLIPSAWRPQIQAKHSLTRLYFYFAGIFIFCLLSSSVKTPRSFTGRTRNTTERCFGKSKPRQCCKIRFSFQNVPRYPHTVKWHHRLSYYCGGEQKQPGTFRPEPENMRVAANHLLTLIDDILNMSKLEDNKVELAHTASMYGTLATIS